MLQIRNVQNGLLSVPLYRVSFMLKECTTHEDENIVKRGWALIEASCLLYPAIIVPSHLVN
jgi:hypothetical protein